MWHSLPIEKILEEFKTDAQNGLFDVEVKKRLKDFGPNQLPEEKPISKIRLLIGQLKSPLIYILVIAGIVTLILKEYADSIIIFGVVFLNAIIGYFQESKAGQTIQALKKMIRVKAIVFRQGEEREIFQEELVPGDIILLRPGDKVPADGRLIDAWNLKLNEAVLTGEWLPSEKNTEILPKDTPLADRDNMVYMGTVVEYGRGKAVVTATGIKTEIGKIAQTLKGTKAEKTPYQKKVVHFSKVLGAIIVFLCLGILIGGLATGKEFFEIFLTAIAVAVAAIPEGLPVAVTLVFTFGMREIFKKKGLVRKLIAAETLGSTTVICTDKTGTLTEAKMQVAGIYTGTKELLSNGKRFEEKIDKDSQASHILALKIAALCNDAFIENLDEPMEKWIARGRPTERVLLLAALQAGIVRSELEAKEPKIDELPFDPTYKYSATLHRLSNEEDVIYVMGAPEIILSTSKFLEIDGKQEIISEERMKKLQEKYEGLTSRGFRVVSVGYKKILRGSLLEKIKKVFLEKSVKKEEKQKLYGEDLKEMVFVGFAALHDPVREKAKEAVNLCRQAGIRPIIVTGDHKLTAMAVAKELGFNVKDKNILEGKELEKMSDEEFKKIFKDIQIYARVEPQQKSKIVQVWQEAGEVVAMTGDGVNDAPALKKANIGVALGSGTDVAKEASDLTLLTDDFEIIVVAVEEGRRIVDNVRKIITYLLVGGFTEVMLIGMAVICRLPLPVLPGQILWKNIIESTPPSLALTFEPKEKDIMERAPEPAKLPLLTKEMNALIFIVGFLTNLILFGLFLWFWHQGYPLERIRSIMFAGLTIDSFFFIFSCRNLRKNIWQYNPFSNFYVTFSVIVGMALLLVAIYLPVFQKLLKTVPFGLFEWSILLIFGLLNLILIELTKFIFIKRKMLN